MANFNTHLTIGAVTAGLGATVTMAAGVAPHDQLLTLTLAGIVGSVLPDIDLEKATPSAMLFSGLGIVLAFITLFQFKKQYSIAELWLAFAAIYAFVRYVLYYIFHKRTRHHGIFHSILAGAFFAALTALIFDQVFRQDSVIAWFAGLFMFGGYLTHLALDEIYAVDFEGARVKRSFGTALKLIDTSSMRASLAMGAALVFVLIAAPSANKFMEIMDTEKVWAFLKDRMLPKGEWFRSKVAELDRAPTETPQSAEAQPVLAPMTAAGEVTTGAMNGKRSQ